MLVNELAKRAGVEAHVVRYYTRIRLLNPARNPDNGYQLFGRDDLWRLRRIQELQALGFSLAEIRELLEHVPDCRTVRAGLARNIARNRRRLSELMELQRRMDAAMTAWGRSGCANPLCQGQCDSGKGIGAGSGAGPRDGVRAACGSLASNRP